MIFDQQNMFYDNSLTGNVIANVGGGDSHNPLFLVICAPTALAGTDVVAALETADNEGFTTNKKVLATYSLPASEKGVLISAKLPYGLKKFVRLNVTGATGGKLTAGLTETVPNWNFE